MFIKNLPMAVFEPQTSGAGMVHSATEPQPLPSSAIVTVGTPE